MRSKIATAVLLVVVGLSLGGCSGLGRWFTSWKATQFGSDWIVVQFKFDGTPFNCWKLLNTSITNEENSDGIYWKDPAGGHLVHISGWYNRVQVENRNYEMAGKLLGVDSAQCGDGKYPSK